MQKSATFILRVVMACLFLSGMAGLVYETVWARYLALFLGHTSYAVVVVLVAFMGGLALGNVWLGARADRSRRPLALYAWLELGIAAYAFVFPYYYEFCHLIFIGLASQFQPNSLGLLALKFGFSLLTILLPTVLMGGTLPILVRLVTRSLGELRSRVATLYFINSIGAVVGCWLADFWWIPQWGLQWTVWGGALLNLAAGLIAFGVSRWVGEGEPSTSPETSPVTNAECGVRNAEFATHPVPEEQGMNAECPSYVALLRRVDGVRSAEVATSPVVEEQYTHQELFLAIGCIGLSGFVAMLYEVVWMRVLALTLGSSTHAFSLMLMTFITGLALGAWWVARWHRLRRTMTAFGWAELALALTLAVSLFFYPYLPYWFVKLSTFLARREEAYVLYELLQAGMCFAVMLVPTVCLGMTLPLASRIATAEISRTGHSVGLVFAINTLGTVLGAVITGFWLLPHLGLARTFTLGIGVNAAIGLALLLRRQLFTRPIRLGLTLSAILVFTVWGGSMLNPIWQRSLSLGSWRDPVPATDLAAYRQRMQQNQLLYYRDGAGSTVSVHLEKERSQDYLKLRVNGKIDAGTGADIITELLLGHLPMLLHSQPRQALVIGLGSGLTCGAILNHPTLHQVEAVEISPEVVTAARLFDAHHGRALDHPRLRVVLEDAKSFLQITERQYDVIVSEPSNPWMAGVAGVFSREYYEGCRAALRTNGLMVQWVQIYESNPRMLQVVLATFTSVFPFLNIWQGTPGDLILIGSTAPVRSDLTALAQRLQIPALKQDFERMQIHRLPVLLALELISVQHSLFIVEPNAVVHSDYHPTLEYIAQRAFFMRSGPQFERAFYENLSARPTTLLGQYLQRQSLDPLDYQAFARFYTTFRAPDPTLFRSLLLRWQRDFPNDPTPWALIATQPGLGSSAETQSLLWQPARDLVFSTNATVELARYYIQTLMQTYSAQRSVFYLPPTDELLKILYHLLVTDVPNRRLYQLLLAELAWDRGDDASCLLWSSRAFALEAHQEGPPRFDLDPKAPARVLWRMIDVLWRRGDLKQAWDLCQQVKQQGYLDRRSFSHDPWLALIYRKMELMFNQSPQ